MKVKLHGHKKIENKNTVKLTTGGRARVRNYRWTDSERGGNVNAGPGLAPPARIPALPLLGDLSKVLWVPPGVQEQCHSRHGASSPPTLRSPCSASGSPGAAAPWAAAAETGLVPSAFIFLVYLFIQLLGLEVLQTVCPATHDFIWGFHKPLGEDMEEFRDYILLKLSSP